MPQWLSNRSSASSIRATLQLSRCFSPQTAPSRSPDNCCLSITTCRRFPNRRQISRNMADKLRDQLIGAWKLVSHVAKPVDGSVPLYPVGEKPMGSCLCGLELRFTPLTVSSWLLWAGSCRFGGSYRSGQCRLRSYFLAENLKNERNDLRECLVHLLLCCSDPCHP